MIDIAPHVRIFEANPTDDLVVKRLTAVKDIAGKFVKPNTVTRLLTVANSVSLGARDGGRLPTDAAAEVAAAITKVSPSFVADGHDLELSTCAMLAAIVAIETGPKQAILTSADYLAIGIWSGMSMHPASPNTKFENLRQLLLAVSRDHVRKAAETARTRSAPAAIAELAPDAANQSKVIASLRSAVSTLTANAAVDREEIDLLWWSIAGWSDVLGRRYADAPPATAAIALGLDAAKRLRRMPTDIHQALVLRRVPAGESVSIDDLPGVLGDDLILLGERFSSQEDVKRNTEVFPVLSTLAVGASRGARHTPLSMSDLASRALLEGVTFDVIYRREV